MSAARTNTGTPASMTLALVAATAIGAAAMTASADVTSDVSAIFETNVQGGTWGFMLKEVDGPVLAAVNQDYLFYPASSIKVVQHLHAMKMVEESNGIDLDTIVQVYTTQDDACDDDHTGQAFTEQTLEDTLRIMMENSGNANTNAIQEFFGRDAINATAHGLGGMSDDTQVNHKFGGYCGGPQANQNQFPLSDASILYERVARGQVFDLEQTRDDFYDLMLNWSYFDDLVDQERPDYLSDEMFDQFKSGIRMARKGGNWGSSISSNMGWVFFPAPPCNDGTPKSFTFGSFVDYAESVDEDFGHQAVVYEMLRDEVRELLEVWQSCTACGSGGACDEVHVSPGCDTGSCCDVVCAADPYCCSSTWDQACVATAINLCDLGPENDDCADAKSISGNGISGGSFHNAGNDGPSHEPECGWNTEFIKDLWFSKTAITDGHLEIQSLASFPTWVAVYETSQCPVTENDFIACHEFPADAVDEVFETCAIQGETYLIRVGALNTETSSVTLHVHNESGFANYGEQDNPNGVGVANQIVADDFELPCGNDGYDWLDLKVVDLDGAGPPSALQWFLYESDAAGTGPGTEIASGFATDMQVTPVEGGAAGGPADLFELGFGLDAMPELFPGTTYWFGIQGPGVLPLQAENQSGSPAHSLGLGSWQPVGGDFAFAIGQEITITPAPCPTDTDGDGDTDIDDLVAVILDFGTSGTAGSTDVDNSGAVDVDDVVAVVLGWGPCS